MSYHYLCIGSSAAGLAAAYKLRQQDATARITVVTAEHEMPYNRCSLVDYLAGERLLDEIRTRKKAFFSDNNITLKLSTPVISLDVAQQQVITAHGERIGYDKLFLGMGRSSSPLTIPGAEGSGVFSFYDLDDTNAIARYIQKGQVKHATIIGAGVTGLECADALVKKGITVAVIQRSHYVLSRQLNYAASAFLEKLAAHLGVVFHKQTTVEEIQRVQGRVVGVHLSDGFTLATDMVVCAVGGRSNAWLAHHAGINVMNGGVVTNEFLQTSVPNIYAGGDVASVKNLLTEAYESTTLWADAGMQGMFAASNMAGRERSYPGIVPITTTEIFGSKLAFVGDVKREGDVKTLTKEDNERYHRFVLQDGVLKGFVMIGHVAQLGSLRQAIIAKQVIASLG